MLHCGDAPGEAGSGRSRETVAELKTLLDQTEVSDTVRSRWDALLDAAAGFHEQATWPREADTPFKNLVAVVDDLRKGNACFTIDRRKQVLDGPLSGESDWRGEVTLFSGEVKTLDEAMLGEVFADVPHSRHPRSVLEGQGTTLVEVLPQSLHVVV